MGAPKDVSDNKKTARLKPQLSPALVKPPQVEELAPRLSDLATQRSVNAAIIDLHPEDLRIFERLTAEERERFRVKMRLAMTDPDAIVRGNAYDALCDLLKREPRWINPGIVDGYQMDKAPIGSLRSYCPTTPRENCGREATLGWSCAEADS
jgi:hypothetical protein